ncbi:MAG: alcohol dehydrogenase catalytic domain-containing protein [Nitrospinota bacterium]
MSLPSREDARSTMRAAVYYRNDDVRLEEIPIPRPGPGELLIRTVASGICGSDVMEWYRVKTAPRVLGHEVTGEVVEVGPGVEDHEVGERVFVSHHVPCNRCRYCLNGDHTVCDTLRRTNFDPGGFSEYIRIPRINVNAGTYRLPEEMSYEEGVFIEPLGCVLRAQRLAKVEPGKTVLIVGSGISGLLHVQLAIAMGAGKVFATDIHEYRMEAARRFGAEVIPSADGLPASLLEANDGRLVDRVIVCTGAPPAVEAAFRCADRGGIVQLFAPTSPEYRCNLNLYHLWHEQITVLSSYGAAPVDLRRSIDLLCLKRVNVRDMITHRVALEEIGKGFRLVAEAGESIKVIVSP